MYVTDMWTTYFYAGYKPLYHVLIICIYKHLPLSKYRIHSHQIKRHVSKNLLPHLVYLVKLGNHNNKLLKKETHLNLRPLSCQPQSSLPLKCLARRSQRAV